MVAVNSVMVRSIIPILSSNQSLFSQNHVPLALLCTVHKVRVELRLMLVKYSVLLRLCDKTTIPYGFSIGQHSNELVAICVEVGSILTSCVRSTAFGSLSSCLVFK